MIVLLAGIAAIWLMDVHPVSGFILLLAVGFALAGLGQRWYRRFRQLRRRAAAEKLIRI